jgi:glycine cleavage system regulatory protein
MQSTLVMTVIGKDRTGLVESVATIIANHGGNWLESRMCRLGGEFAGILRVQLPGDKRSDLEKSLSTLPGLKIVVQNDDAANPSSERRLADLEVVGHDRPGIIREITHALAAQGVNVEELSTKRASAPMSGEPLFTARALVSLPANVTASGLRETLQKAAADMTIEIGPVKTS